jgi:hypothetical protein
VGNNTLESSTCEFGDLSTMLKQNQNWERSDQPKNYFREVRFETA